MTPQFAAYVAPARRNNQLWRVALGLCLIVAVYFGWSLLLDRLALLGFAVWQGLGLTTPGAGPPRITSGPEPGTLDGLGADPATMLLLLATFLGGWLGVWLVARGLHGRGWRSLFGHPPRVLADFGLGVSMMLVIGGGATALAWPWLPSLQPGLPLSLWLTVLPLGLLGVLVQTGAEELIFRGYLQQQLAARLASPLVWMVLPSVLFGLAHLSPDQGGTLAWLIVAATTLFGLIAADLTARTGTLGLAWGLHFANNVLAILIVTAMPGLGGLALWQLGPDAADILAPLLLADMVLLVAVWAGCRLWLRRR
jgi:uncharacterized protein